MVRRILCAVLLACFVVGLSGSTAHALNSFTANFSEKELKLKNPTDADWEALRAVFDDPIPNPYRRPKEQA